MKCLPSQLPPGLYAGLVKMHQDVLAPCIPALVVGVVIAVFEEHEFEVFPSWTELTTWYLEQPVSA